VKQPWVIQSYLPGGADAQSHLIHSYSDPQECAPPPNGISIGSVVLLGSPVCPTHCHPDMQTDVTNTTNMLLSVLHYARTYDFQQLYWQELQASLAN